MRWSLLLSLAAFLFTLPAAGAAPPAKPTPAKPKLRQVTATTAKPVVHRADVTSGRPINGRNLRAARYAGMKYAQHAHPGLDGSGVEAGNFCGHMLMPAAELKEVSRGLSRGHAGLDLMAPHGSPVRAAAAGTVIYAGWYYAYGNIVDIRHADGVITRYAHMSALSPEAGEGVAVQAGEEIGKVGATGHASGPHIHFEVRIGGRPVSPKPYLALASCAGVEPQDEILEASAGDPQPRAVHRTQRAARRAAPATGRRVVAEHQARR